MRVSPAVSMMVNSRGPSGSTRPGDLDLWRSADWHGPFRGVEVPVRVSTLRGCRRRGVGRSGAPRTRKGTMVASKSSSSPTAGSISRISPRLAAAHLRVRVPGPADYWSPGGILNRPTTLSHGTQPKLNHRPSHRRQHSGRLCHFFPPSCHNPSSICGLHAGGESVDSSSRFDVHALIANGVTRTGQEVTSRPPMNALRVMFAANVGPGIAPFHRRAKVGRRSGDV